MSYKFYTDSGHGWLEVPLAELRELGIADKISGYSYIRGDFAYLEEDRDAGIFDQSKGPESYPVKEVYEDGRSIIRTFEPYNEG